MVEVEVVVEGFVCLFAVVCEIEGGFAVANLRLWWVELLCAMFCGLTRTRTRPIDTN